MKASEGRVVELTHDLNTVRESAEACLFAKNMIGSFGSVYQSAGMDTYEGLAKDEMRKAVKIAAELADIGTPAAFKALAEAYKNGLRLIAPQIRQFGEIGERFLRPRTMIDRVFGRRKWIE